MKARLARLTTVLVLLGVGLAAGCGAPSDDATPAAGASVTPRPTTPAETAEPSPSPGPSATIRPALVRSVRRTLQAFLDAWSREGLFPAARRYLTADLQPRSHRGLPRLVAGSISHSSVGSWESDDHFTLIVDLTLQFSGDRGAWDEGLNTRFVTATRASRNTQFRLAFATSP